MKVFERVMMAIAVVFLVVAAFTLSLMAVLGMIVAAAIALVIHIFRK